MQKTRHGHAALVGNFNSTPILTDFFYFPFAVLQLLVLQPGIVKTDLEPPSLKSLITDPYILIASGAITFANMGIAMLEPSLPIWMIDNMDATELQQGAIFLPASISYLIGTNLFGPLGHRMGRWLAALLGLIIIGACLTLVSTSKKKI